MFDDDLDYLRRFDRGIRLIQPQEASQPIPQSWQQIFAIGDPVRRVRGALSLWEQVASDTMPRTLGFMQERCVDVRLCESGKRTAMLYCWVNDVGRNCYYAGGNPLDIKRDTRFINLWRTLPEGLFDFYARLHNGFYYFPSESNGPAPLAQIFWLSQLQWGILDQLEEPVEINLETSLALFSNGGGGYIAYDYERHLTATWWADDQPTYHSSFWQLMDVWTSLSMAE